jgi:hypothetical protein
MRLFGARDSSAIIKSVVVDERRFDGQSRPRDLVSMEAVSSYTDVKLELSPHTHGRRVE